MLSYVLPIRPQEVVRLLQEEIAATHQQPELYYSASEDYLVEADFDHTAYGSTGERYSRISVDAVLNIEPRLEHNYWVLRVVVHRNLGRQKLANEATLIGATLTLDQFKALLADHNNTVSVRLDVTTPFAREHFDAWLDEQCRRHPVAAAAND